MDCRRLRLVDLVRFHSSSNRLRLGRDRRRCPRSEDFGAQVDVLERAKGSILAMDGAQAARRGSMSGHPQGNTRRTVTHLTSLMSSQIVRAAKPVPASWLSLAR